MDTILIACVAAIAFLCVFLAYLWRHNHRLLFDIIKKQNEIERKFDYFDRHWLATLKEVEKKIHGTTEDVASVKNSFRDFQSKFLEMDKKIDEVIKHSDNYFKE